MPKCASEMASKVDIYIQLLTSGAFRNQALGLFSTLVIPSDPPGGSPGGVSQAYILGAFQPNQKMAVTQLPANHFG